MIRTIVNALATAVNAASPAPSPSPSLDLSLVQPGPWFPVFFFGLVGALIVLVISMNRHLKKASNLEDIN